MARIVDSSSAQVGGRKGPEDRNSKGGEAIEVKPELGKGEQDLVDERGLTGPDGSWSMVKREAVYTYINGGLVRVDGTPARPCLQVPGKCLQCLQHLPSAVPCTPIPSISIAVGRPPFALAYLADWGVSRRISPERTPVHSPSGRRRDSIQRHQRR